jgi:hypothetical protein
MKQLLLFTFFFISLAGTIYAQDKNPIIPKDSVFHKKDTTIHPKDSVFHTVLSSTGSYNKAINVVTYLFTNNLDFGLKKKIISLSFDNNWIYGRSGGNLTNNDYSSTLQFNLYKSLPHFFYWGLASYNTSYSLKINGQALAGAGAAYSIFDRKKVFLNISDGLVFDHSDLVLPDSSRLHYQTVRNSFRIMFKFVIKDIFSIDGSDFLQNSFVRSSDYIIKSTTNVSLKLNKWINLTSSLQYNNEKRTQSSNLTFTYGLKFDRFF